MRLPMLLITVILALAPLVAAAEAPAGPDYGLTPVEIAPDTWLVEGRREDFSLANGGNIVNTAFIVTEAGVLVIDTGPSRLYGEQLRAAIARVTDRPVVRVLNTHLHPDHVLGNQAFEDVPIAALAGTAAGVQLHGESFNDNLYRLVGRWMAGTRVVAPTETLEPGTLELGGHRLRLIALRGHTDADLVILDQTTGVLFAGDLVFDGRTPTTPHAQLTRWREALMELRGLDFQVLVPGHGPVSHGPAAIDQTADYLDWLGERLAGLAETGASMGEALDLETGSAPPAGVRELAVFEAEYPRSVAHLYPELEARALLSGRVEPE